MFNKQQRAGVPTEANAPSGIGMRLKAKSDEVAIEEEILSAAGLEPLD